MKKIKKMAALLIACVMIICMGAGYAVAEEAAGEGVIKIGYVGPITGPMGHFCVGINRTIENCLAKMNETGYEIGGVNYKIEVVCPSNQICSNYFSGKC